jgi:hypothetical protein
LGYFLLVIPSPSSLYQDGVVGSGDDTPLSAKSELLCATRDLKGLLEDLKRLSVSQDLVCNPTVGGHGGDGKIGIVLFLHKNE